MYKLLLYLGSISGFIIVALGAFGAHALKDTLQKTGRTDNFETGVKYQMFHTIAIFICAILINKIDSKLIGYAGYCFGIGTLLFSGSLYALSITGITKLGAITPIGGLGFLVGWVLLFLAVLKAA